MSNSNIDLDQKHQIKNSDKTREEIDKNMLSKDNSQIGNKHLQRKSSSRHNRSSSNDVNPEERNRSHSKR